MALHIKNIGKLIALFTFGSIVSGCGGESSFTPDTEATQNKISGFYYSFDETGATIIDSSGNDFNGAASSLSRVTGKVNGAIQFLGVGSNIELPVINDYFPFETGFTFRSWIKVDAPITVKQQIIGGETAGRTAPTVRNFGISLVNDSISLEVPAQQNTTALTTSALSFPINTWFHVALTYDGDAVSIYYNGNLVGTDSILTTYTPFFRNYIGNNLRIFGGIQVEDQFTGYMDELYLENKILSQKEIADYYASTM